MSKSKIFLPLEDNFVKKVFFTLLSPGRTGSTLLTHLLKQHPEIDIVSEPYLIRVEKSIDPKKIEEFYTLYKYSLVEMSHRKYIGIAEKTGENYDNLVNFFSKHIIFIIRDPRDALVSAKEKWFAEKDIRFSRFENAKQYLDSYLKLIEWVYGQQKLGKINLCLVRYEDLVKNPKKSLTYIFNFLRCSIEYTDGCISDAQTNKWRSRGDKKLSGKVAKIHSLSIGRWETFLTKSELDLINKKYLKLMKITKYDQKCYLGCI
ncbi:MAG TPA: sulfotransferase [Patescibacteria group bacterium]|nr:sulfotransferase [Patescibacteria group bacterium]